MLLLSTKEQPCVLKGSMVMQCPELKCLLFAFPLSPVVHLYKSLSLGLFQILIPTRMLLFILDTRAFRVYRVSRCVEALTRPQLKSSRAHVFMDYDHSFSDKTVGYSLYITVLTCIQVLKYSSGSKADFQVPWSQDCN